MSATVKRGLGVLTPVAALICSLLFAGPVLADGWVSKWSNGFKIENEDEGHELKFGGRLMADYTFADDDQGGTEDGFEFRRARLFFSGTVYGRVEFKLNYDFAGGDADAKDVWVAIKNDWGKIKFGHFKEPFGLEELNSSKYITFLERAAPVEAFAPSRNSGFGFEGKNGDKFNWGAGYFYDSDGFGESVSEDQTNLTARVAFRPIYEDKGARLLHLGAAVNLREFATGTRFRARPGAHLSGRLVDTGNFAADSADLFNFELAGVFGPFWFASEYFSVDVEALGFGDPSFAGYYAQAGFFLTGEHRRFKTSDGVFNRIRPSDNFGKDGGRGAWEIALRVSNIDLTDAGIAGGEQDEYSVGVNWYLNPVTRLMINYVTADIEGGDDSNFFLVRWQIDF